MAKILYGGGVANMSGSQAGTVHSHNQFGAYTRNRVVPVNPQSANQTLARTRLSYCSQVWRSLSDAERLDWAALGAQIVRSDSLGQTYTLKGFNAFCLVNVHRLAKSLAVVNDAPLLDDAPVFNVGIITADDTPALTIAYTATGGLATNSFEIWASAPVSQGKTYINPSQLKKVSTILGNAVSPANIAAAYATVFGDVIASGIGERIFFEIRPFSASGLPGPVVRKSEVIVAS